MGPIRKSLVAPTPLLPCQLSLPRPLSCVLRESETRPRLRIEREQILYGQLASFHMHECEALTGTRTMEIRKAFFSIEQVYKFALVHPSLKCLVYPLKAADSEHTRHDVNSIRPDLFEKSL